MIVIPLLLALAAVPALAGTSVEYEIFQGKQRSYAVTIPAGCVPRETVVALHGRGGSHAMLWRYGLDVEAQEHCKVVIAPDSLRESWNKDLSGPDVLWLEDLIERQRGPINFLGHSAGATMAQAMHWCLGYGRKVVLSGNSTTDAVRAECAPFDGGHALLVMGRDDPFWEAGGKPAFLEFVNDVAQDSECGRYEQHREDGVVYRHYSRCDVDVIVPLALAHDWWEPLADVAFDWMYVDRHE